jgi:hypothetical protein
MPQRTDRSRRRGVVGALVVACVAVSLAACGAAVTFDADAAEVTIAQEFPDRFGAKVRSVQCPADVPVRRGVSFDCAVLTDGGTPVDVTARFADNAGAFAWEPAAPAVDTAALEADVAAALSTPTEAVTVECPQPVFAAPGGTFTCEAVDPDGGRASVPVTIGADGTPTWSLRLE